MQYLLNSFILNVEIKKPKNKIQNWLILNLRQAYIKTVFIKIGNNYKINISIHRSIYSLYASFSNKMNVRYGSAIDLILCF